MHSPIRALIWEQWRHIRWPMLLACLAIVAAAVIQVIILHNRQNVLEAFFPTVVVLTLVVLVSQGDVNDMQVSFPYRLFTLPVRTHVLVGCVLFTRLLAIGLLACVTLGVYYLWFAHTNDTRVHVLAFIPFTFFFAVLTVCVQAILWWPGWPMPVRLAVAVLACVGLSVLPAYMQPPARTVFFAAAILIAYAIAVAGATLDRRGMNAPVAKWLLARIWQPAGRVTPFKSRMHALLWYEWKTRGRMLPMLAVFVLALLTGSLLGVLGLEYRRLDLVTLGRRLFDTPLLVFYAFMVCPLFSVLLMGILLPGIGHKERVSGISIFTMTRPLSTRILAAARLRTEALSIGVMFILMTLIASTTSGTLMSTVESLIPAEVYDLPFSATIIVVCLLISHLAVCWTILWLGPVLLGAYVLLGSLGAAIVVLSEHFLSSVFMNPFFEHPFFEQGHILWLPVVGFVLLAAWPFYAAYRRGLLTTRTLCMMAVAWPVISIGLVAYGVAVEAPIGPGGGWVVPGTAVAAALALIPLLPLATVPLTMAWFRHR